ncbi:MAG: HEAT repeat domain-containing protein, partial [Armatimonadota bacterium]
MTGSTASAYLRAGLHFVAALVVLSVTLASGVLADPPGAAYQDLLRGLIVKVAVVNDYKLLAPLIGADDATAADLAKLVQDPQLSPRQRAVAAIALSYVRTPAALATLLSTLSDPHPAVRQGVAYALGYFCDETGAVREALTRMATTDTWNYTDPKTGLTRYFVRESAQGALTRLAQAQPLATPATTPPAIPAYAPTPMAAAPTTTGTTPALPQVSAWSLIAPPTGDLPSCLSTLQVSGTWEKLPDSGGQLNVTPDGRLTLNVPAGAPITVKRSEPLPAGPWTLNLWRSTTTLDPEDQLSLTLGSLEGDPGRAVAVELSVTKWHAAVQMRVLGGTWGRSPEFAVYHARGPVQWLQLSYT